MLKITTTVLTALTLSLIASSNIASADIIKEVIISEQSAPIGIRNDVPIQVELEPGGFIHSAPIPTVPAQVKRYSRTSVMTPRGEDTLVAHNFLTVERDSIIKFVNTTINTSPFAFTVFDPNSIVPGSYCAVDVDIVFPPVDGPVNEIPIENRIPIARSKSNTTNMDLNQQFATGGIFLPKGTIILNTLRVSGFEICQVGSYGVLFEQD